MRKGNPPKLGERRGVLRRIAPKKGRISLPQAIRPRPNSKIMKEEAYHAGSLSLTCWTLFCIEKQRTVWSAASRTSGTLAAYGVFSPTPAKLSPPRWCQGGIDTEELNQLRVALRLTNGTPLFKLSHPRELKRRGRYNFLRDLRVLRGRQILSHVTGADSLAGQ